MMASPVTMADLQWKQCASGQYERSMDEIEGFYTFMASQTAALKREQGSITAAFKIAFKSSDITAAAQEAWKTLRYDHPTLASTVEGDKKVYRVADEEELNRWLKTTFIVNDHSATSRELYSTLRPVKQITLHLLLKSHELVLQSPHNRIDGIGCILLFNNLLSILASPRRIEFGDEAKNLSPPLKVAAQLPPATEVQDAKFDAQVQQWLQSFPAVGLAVPSFEKIPGATKIRHFTLSKEETSHVLSARKNHGLTTTHVVHAAAILAAKKHGCHPDGKKYASFGLFSLREWCDTPFNTGKHANAVYSNVWPCVVTPTNLLDTAKELKTFYTTTKADQDVPAMLGPGLMKLIPIFATTPPVPPSEPFISSLGHIDSRIQKTYGSIEVQDFWLATNILTAQVMTYIWTFQGQLTVEASYNEEYHTDESIEHFLQMTKAILLEEL
jgi:hypothetical protein